MSLISDYDVVVIGAGAAGLAASAELMAKGKSVICLEAMHRIGGRCYTDHSILGCLVTLVRIGFTVLAGTKLLSMD